jgi:hypothetical protein
MLIQAKIKQYLQAKTALTALVGTRIYPNYVPETSIHPAISYFMVSNVRPHIKDGHIGEAQPRFQFDIWADSYGQAVEVERELITALDDFNVVDGIYHSEYVGGNEAYEQAVKLHHFVVDYTIIYKE